MNFSTYCYLLCLLLLAPIMEVLSCWLKWMVIAVCGDEMNEA